MNVLQLAGPEKDDSSAAMSAASSTVKAFSTVIDGVKVMISSTYLIYSLSVTNLSLRIWVTMIRFQSILRG
tara:strand:+ start:1337 stop:1549 length:213 start_codon:yes stop_codon:yes gene_type:complete